MYTNLPSNFPQSLQNGCLTILEVFRLNQAGTQVDLWFKFNFPKMFVYTVYSKVFKKPFEKILSFYENVVVG